MSTLLQNGSIPPRLLRAVAGRPGRPRRLVALGVDHTESVPDGAPGFCGSGLRSSCAGFLTESVSLQNGWRGAIPVPLSRQRVILVVTHPIA